MSGPARHPTIAGVPWPVVAIAAAAVGVLLLLSPLYGWHRDELYFVVAGRHPAFGYVDQPPFTRLLSAAAVALLGPSPTAVRILPALVMGLLVVLAALMARDLGGSHRAQVIAALAVALSGALAVGHIGITKQKIVQSGAFKLPGRDADSAQELIANAVEMANSGVFALVLECLPVRLGEIITRSLDIPTISIGR